MTDAVVNTKSGGAFRLSNAFLLGMDHIVGELPFRIYEIQDGDQITFVS